jgi:hypothetical protein
VPKYVLDTNCYITAAHDPEARTALGRLVEWASPFLYLSAVVAALERTVLDPFIRRDRVLTPGPQAWDASGLTLATLGFRKRLKLAFGECSPLSSWPPTPVVRNVWPRQPDSLAWQRVGEAGR